MLPSFSGNSLNRRVLGDSYGSCYAPGSFSGGASPSHVSDDRVGENRLPLALSFRLAALCDAIRSIVRIGAKKQVVRANARRVVATMENLKTCRDGSNCDEPGNSMSANGRSPDRHLPISFSVSESRPLPAPGAALHMSIKPAGKRLGFDLLPAPHWGVVLCLLIVTRAHGFFPGLLGTAVNDTDRGHSPRRSENRKALPSSPHHDVAHGLLGDSVLTCKLSPGLASISSTTNRNDNFSGNSPLAHSLSVPYYGTHGKQI